MILNFLTGAGVKIAAGWIWKMMQQSQESRLLAMSADTDRIVKLQGGVDVADDWTRWTRRIIALALIGLWCFVIVWVVVLNPETEYKIVINKHPSFLFQWIFGSTDKTVLAVSAGSLLWDFKSMIEILVGFYFTKFGR